MKLDKYIEISNKISQLKHNSHMTGLCFGQKEYDESSEYEDLASKLFKEILNELMEEVQ